MTANPPASKKPRKARQNRAPCREIGRRGVRIACKPGQVKTVGARRWSVASQSVPGKWYRVNLAGHGFTCECRHHESRGSRCKHIIAAEIVLMEKTPEGEKSPPVTLGSLRPFCSHCKSNHHAKDGRRRCKRRDPVQRFKCRDCGHRFSEGFGFVGRHVAPTFITMALTVFGMGLSPAQACLLLKVAGVTVHPSTVQRWADRYGKQTARYVRTLRPPGIGTRWSADEKFKRIRGMDRWVFAVMDSATRFILSHDVSPTKFSYNATPLLEAAKKRAGFAPRMFVTDGLQAFGVAFRRAFRTRANPPIHISEIHLQNQRCNNNCHERFNGELGDRFKTSRGLKKEDSALIGITMIHHNFVRPHMGLNKKTPADSAGIRIPHDDKWLVLIQNAALDAA